MEDVCRLRRRKKEVGKIWKNEEEGPREKKEKGERKYQNVDFLTWSFDFDKWHFSIGPWFLIIIGQVCLSSHG